MPMVAEGIYAQYYDSVIKMAKRSGGVSRPEIMKGLSVTRPAADRLIDECRLKRSRTEGRTDFFKPTKATDKVLDSAESGEPSEASDNGKDDTTMINEQDQAALLSAMVADDPATSAHEAKQTAPPIVNRLPQNPVAQKGTKELDGEIVALKKAIDDAEEKAKNGHKTYVVQTAHANALGAKLQRVLEARLAL